MEEVRKEDKDSDTEGAKVKEEGLTPDRGAEKLKTVELAKTVAYSLIEDEKVDEENFINFVKMETEEKLIEKTPEPLSEAELSQA